MGFWNDACNAFLPGAGACKSSPSPSPSPSAQLTPATDDKISCSMFKTLISPITPDKLRDFKTDKNCKPSGTWRTSSEELEDWIESKRNEYCNSDALFYADDPGGGKTCQERIQGQDLAKEWCSLGNRIKLDGSIGTENLCSEDYVGEEGYKELARNYCNTSRFQTDEFCRCANVMKHGNPQYNDFRNNKFCDRFPNAAGCSTMKSLMDPILESTPIEYRHLFDDKGHCKGLICSQSADEKIYLPEGYDSGCDNNISICNNTFNVGTATGSTISAACNFENSDDNVPFQSGSGSGSGPSPSPSPSPSPFSFESNFILGGGGVVGVASIMFLLIVIIVVAKSQRR